MFIASYISRQRPDVALGIESSAPINFAMRNAALDLTQFDDFEEVAQRFHKSALVPFTFRIMYMLYHNNINFLYYFTEKMF